MERNLRRARAHHDSLMRQRVAAEDAPEMARLLDAEMQSVEHIIEEEQAHRVQVAALSQMQLQAMERVEEQERELRRLSELMAQHQAILTSSPERPQPQSLPVSPPHNLARLREEVLDVLPGTVNTVRGAADKVGQVSDLGIHRFLQRTPFMTFRRRTSGGDPCHSPEVGQIPDINTHGKTRGET